jgi:hypothetical protein
MDIPKAQTKLLPACLFVGVIVFGCTSAMRQQGYPVKIDMGEGEVLTDAQVSEYTERARHGDGEAAYRLFAHYSLGTRDAQNAQKYFDRAIALEYPTALYSEAIQL